MPGPKPGALPLGHSPSTDDYVCKCKSWFESRTRLTFGEPVATSLQTSLQALTPLRSATGGSHPECQDQNLVPYHLATPHRFAINRCNCSNYLVGLKESDRGFTNPTANRALLACPPRGARCSFCVLSAFFPSLRADYRQLLQDAALCR